MEDQTKLKVGDVVELISGSPKMTVEEVEAYKVKLIYYNDTINDFKHLTVEPGAIRKVE